VKDLKDIQNYKHVKEIIPSKENLIELVEGDLNTEVCWNDIINGCDYVIHVASPIP